MTSASSEVQSAFAAFTQQVFRARWWRWAAPALVLIYVVIFRGCSDYGLFAPDAPVRLVAQLALALLAGLWLGQALWRRRGVAAAGLEPVALVLFAAFALNAALSHDPRRSAGQLGLMLLYALWFYAVFDWVRRFDSADAVARAFLAVGGAVLLVGLNEALGWFGPWALSTLGGSPTAVQPVRIMSTLEHPNILSAFLNLLLPLAIVQVLRVRSSWMRALLILWIAAYGVLQILTSSRAGWIGAAATVGVLAALGWWATGGGAQGRVAQWWVAVRGRLVLLIGASLLVLLSAAGAVALAWFQAQHGSHGSSLWYARAMIWSFAVRTFQSSPWHGTGMSTFSTEVLRYFPVPPYLKHAHSVPMTILAEGGLLGLLPFALLSVTVGRALQRAWRASRPTAARLCVAGGVAALVGLAVHSLFDDFTTRPALMMTALAVLALTLAAPGGEASEAPAGRRATVARHAIHPALLLAPALLLLGAGIGSDWALAAHNEGVSLSRLSRWEDASRSFARAAARDGRFAFYHLQRGFALGVTAFDARHDALLPDAIAAYEAGIRLEPNGSANHVNLFGLNWQAGLRDKALRELQQALELAHAGIWDTRTNEYGGQVFRRTGMRPDLLPQVQVLFSDGPIITEAALGRFTALARRYRDLEDAESAGRPVPAVGRWANGAVLLAAERHPRNAPPGTTVDVTQTWWLPRPLPDTDYTVFVQVRGRDNRNLAQCDARLLWGRNIPTRHGEGYWVTWQCTLTVPATLGPGAYDVKTGLYDLRTMERATVIDDRSGEAAVDLDVLQVAAPSP